LKYKYNRNIDDLNEFIDELPDKLKVETSLFVHAKTYREIYFLIGKRTSFLAWVCPLLKPYLSMESSYVYFEGEKILNIYFFKGGEAGFVLPKHRNLKFIDINKGECFGVVDICASMTKTENYDKFEFNKDLNLKRVFTIRT